MLRSLTITNFALIEKTNIEFCDSLNVVTGETGAGKSIFMDALSAVIGARSSPDSIRKGTDYFKIEACFDITGLEHIVEILEQAQIPPEDDGSLIISRRLNRHGKNQITINGSQTTLNVLKKLGEKMIDLHGQHENQALLKTETHLNLLDNYDANCREIRREYQKNYKKWLESNSEIERIKQTSRDILQRQDMLSWQTREIAAVKLISGEEERLENSVRIMSNAEKIVNLIDAAYSLLEQGQRGGKSITSALAEVKRNLENVARYDSAAEKHLEVIDDCFYQLQDVACELKDYLDDIEFNPAKLAKLQERLDAIDKLKRKYGPTVEDVLKYYEEAKEELDSIENFDKRLEKLEEANVLLKTELENLAANLDDLRQKAAQTLSKEITMQLNELGMNKAVFRIDVKKLAEFSPNGLNEVTFLFSANPGEDVKMLSKIASGGEISRVALAIKAVCAYREQPDVMIFDEIDAGIGGQTAQMVAEKIAAISASSSQILCITHLPQIACMADCHIHVSKHVIDEKTANESTIEERTVTKIRELTKKEQKEEIARMLSGDATQRSLQNAAEMIEAAQNKKINWQNKAQG